MLEFGIRLVVLIVSIPAVASLLAWDFIRAMAEIMLLGTKAECAVAPKSIAGRWVTYVMTPSY